MSDFVQLTESCSVNLLEAIGCGAVGVVHLGHHEIAVKRVYYKDENKQIDEKIKELAMQEVTNFKKMKYHPNIVQHYNYRDDGSSVWIMMEYCDEGSLDTFLEERSTSTLLRIQIMKQVCEGMKYLHALGIFHGDLKPGNILVKKDGEEYVFKLTDFSGSGIKGTYQYMAPELLTDSSTPDMFKADLFSLGLLFKDITEVGISKTGQNPYSHTPFGKQLLEAFHQGQPRPTLTVNGDISDETKKQLQQLINAMTVLDTTDRLSLSDVYHKLDAIEMSLIHNEEKQEFIDIKYALRSNFTTLVHNLKPEVMLIHCFSQSIISEDELEQLRRASDYLGLIYQSEMLLNIILGKVESDIWGFLQILKKTQPDVYQLLSPSMSKEEYESSSLGDSLHEVIQQNYTDFCERIVAMEITPVLFQEHLLTVQEFIALTQGRDKHGLHHQRKMLIDTLLKKNPSQLKKFVHILKPRQPSLYFIIDKNSLKDLRAHFKDLKHFLIDVYTANKSNIVTDLPGEKWKLDVNDRTQLIPLEFAVEKKILVTNVKMKAAHYKYVLNFNSIEAIVCALSKENESRLLLITGNPGCGKTVFVHTLVSQWMQQSDPELYEAMFLIPVRNIAIEASLLEILSSSRKGLSYIKDSFTEVIDALLCNRDTARQILIILDGIDEVLHIPSHCDLYRLLTGQKYPFVRIIVTSRFEAKILNSILPDYKVEISGISKHSFNEYINNKLGRPDTEWENDQLRQLDFHLTETPFYITIAAFLLKKYSSQKISHKRYVLPSSSTQLFNVFIGFLLRIWLQRLGRLQDAEVLALDKNVLDRESNVPVDIKSKLVSFGYMGYSFLKRKKPTFTQQDLFEMLIDISDVEQSGFFCISSGEMWFRHKHLQEFLAALYLTHMEEDLLVIRLFQTAIHKQEKAILSTIFQDVHSVMPFVFGLSPSMAKSILEYVKSNCCVGNNNNAIDIGYEAKLCFEAQNREVDAAMINILLNCENKQTGVFHYSPSVSNVYRLCNKLTTAQAQAILHNWYGLELESNGGHWNMKNSSTNPQSYITCEHNYLHIKTLNDCLFFILSNFSFPQVESLKIERSCITDIKRITQCFPNLQKLDLNNGKPEVDWFLENKCVPPLSAKESRVSDLTLRCFDDPLPNTSLMNLFEEQSLQLLKLKWVNNLFAELNKLIRGTIWPNLRHLEICLWKIEESNMESVYNNLEVLGQSLTQLQSLTFGCNLNNTSIEKDPGKRSAFQEQFLHSTQVRFQGLSVLRLHRVLFPDDINALCRCLKHLNCLQKLGLCWRDVAEKEQVLLKELEKIEHVNTLEIMHGSPDIKPATVTKESFENYKSSMTQCKTTISLWKWTLAVGIEEVEEKEITEDDT